MTTVTGSIVIGRPLEEVFDFVADQRNEPGYNPEITSCEKTTPGPIGVGTTFVAETKMMGSVVPVNVEIIGFERPHRIASWAHIEGTMDIRGSVDLEWHPEGTLMSWHWNLEPHGCTKLLSPWLARTGRQREERIWTALKTLLESRPEAA